MTRRFSPYLVAAASLLLPLLVGCSLIGLGIGEASSRPDENVKGWDLITVESGRMITITFRDLRQLTGRYKGPDRLSREEYASRYEEWLVGDKQQLGYPVPGSEVNVTSVAGTNANGIFHGFDQGRMYLTAPGRSSIWTLEDVVSISDTTGTVLPRALLFDETSFGTVPLYTGFLVDTDSVVRFDSREVESIAVHSRNSAMAGFAIGLMVDLGIVVAVALTSDVDRSASGSSSGWGSSSEGSCPFVYSHDGQDFVFDAEPLGTLFFRGTQRSDFHRLNHLKATDGNFRIRLTTELDETDYVDHLSLRVIEHPEGTEVVPTMEGALVVSSQRIVPASAVQFNGMDALEAVRSRDSELWVSNPFGRNLNDHSQLRDGLVLEFPTKDGAQSATLITTMRAQPWTAVIPGKMDKLMGEQLEAMHEQMDNDASLFYELLDREPLPKVEVWSGSGWQDVGRIYGISPFVLTDRALNIELPPSPDEVIRVRISSTAGIWMIDQVAIDYDAPEAAHVTSIPAIRAIDETGRDVLESLASIDDDYFVMPGIGSRADVMFEAPPARAGLARTVVLETNGYYRVHVKPEGPPQTDLLRQLLVEPGVFSQWALEGLYDQMDALALGLPAASGAWFYREAE